MNKIHLIIVCVLIWLFVLSVISELCQADTWEATYYCSCVKCCGKSEGITASGKIASEGTVAINWLPFGTKVLIDGKVYRVEDRGAKSIFGTKKNKINRVDIWVSSHKEAIQNGRKKVELIILK